MSTHLEQKVRIDGQAGEGYGADMGQKPPWECDVDELPAVTTKPPRSGPGAFDPTSQNSVILAGRVEESLTPKQKTQRQLFVTAYFTTFNQTESAILAGFAEASAAKKGSELMREPYVQELLRQFKEKQDEATILDRKRVILGMLREAHFEGAGASHGARVSAWDKLSKILGMQVDKTELTVPSGVTLNVSIGGKKLSHAADADT